LYSEFIKEILLEYEKIQDFEEKELEQRKAKVYSSVPKIRKIDEKINEVGILLSKMILTSPEDFENSLKNLKEQLEKLKQEKAFLLTENNIPLDFLKLNYQCKKCKDTGFLPDGQKCDCFKQRLIDKAYEMSSIGKVLEKENFQHFDIDFFSDTPFEDEELTPKQNMLNILNICEGFVINFDNNPNENLLFYGATGLGKTFLCNCIAKALLDKEKIVVYQTAFKIFEIIESYKFSKNLTPDINMAYQLLFDCDLLILDDLGTELTNTFTNTELFNILNTRLIQNKKMVISTNLSPVDIANTYSDRVLSRLFGSFTKLKFYGNDIRWKK
jgi:DNA replication protein DnaC